MIDLDHDGCTVTQTLFDDAEIARMFGDKWSYLRDFQAARGHEVVAEKASRAPVPDDMFEQLKVWWEPLMKRAPFLSESIGAPVRFTIGDLDLVVDFPAAEVRHYADEKVRYWYTTSADLVATNLRDGEIDWSNSLFLSLRFAAGRVGKFNEYLYTFFKCLSEERIDYVENWYSEQGDTGEDIAVSDWIVQRRCPHLHADLKKFGTTDGDVLTCNLHGWQFDLASGRCLTSRGHEIRARRAGADA